MRNNQGKWNLEQWLPPAKAAAEASARVYGPPAAIAPVNRLLKIDFDDGRVNFKNGDEKLPFALTDVSGSVDQVSPGRWELRLEAQPWRSGVVLQSAGTVLVRGDVAGTSARLQPAQITVHWEQVSLADLFRLLRGQRLRSARRIYSGRLAQERHIGQQRGRSGRRRANGIFRWKPERNKSIAGI